jgi:serine/threonine protein kinase
MEIGSGANGVVFRVFNTKTKETKALKSFVQSKDKSSLSSDLQIGMELSRACNFLVRYENVFIIEDFPCIIMEYFENGDLQKYLNTGHKLNAEVLTLFIYFFFFTNVYLGCISFNISNFISSFISSQSQHHSLEFESGKYICNIGWRLQVR